MALYCNRSARVRRSLQKAGPLETHLTLMLTLTCALSRVASRSKPPTVSSSGRLALHSRRVRAIATLAMHSPHAPCGAHKLLRTSDGESAEISLGRASLVGLVARAGTWVLAARHDVHRAGCCRRRDGTSSPRRPGREGVGQDDQRPPGLVPRRRASCSVIGVARECGTASGGMWSSRSCAVSLCMGCHAVGCSDRRI